LIFFCLNGKKNQFFDFPTQFTQNSVTKPAG
jgi:hypothetical protein